MPSSHDGSPAARAGAFLTRFNYRAGGRKWMEWPPEMEQRMREALIDLFTQHDREIEEALR